ncbi:MAG TPA: DUF1338 family protein [Pseudomonadota bacterium]|nr:DUF1338 family protein [Pseudomonadota bacterium]
MINSASTLLGLLTAVCGEPAAQRLLATVHVSPRLRENESAVVSRAELAQAMNLLLFDGLLGGVPDAARYVGEVSAAGSQVVFDHGALRTVLSPTCGALPPGEAAFTRFLRPLGFRCTGTYPLTRLRMTGRAYTHADLPEDIAQYFVSELHPESFSPQFQDAVGRVVASSRDPLAPADITRIERLGRDGCLPLAQAVELLPRLVRCFGRHHELPAVADYETLLAESAEMAWISTEGNAFNHATDRVPDVAALAEALRARGYPMKDSVEISRSGRVRQTALRAATVLRQLGGAPARAVPGSFYEFISRDSYTDDHGQRRLDLAFDASNATGIFKMTVAS